MNEYLRLFRFESIYDKFSFQYYIILYFIYIILHIYSFNFVFSGLKESDLKLVEQKHTELLKKMSLISTCLIMRQNGDLFTRIHLIRKIFGTEDFLEVLVYNSFLIVIIYL